MTIERLKQNKKEKERDQDNEKKKEDGYSTQSTLLFRAGKKKNIYIYLKYILKNFILILDKGSLFFSFTYCTMTSLAE